MFQRPLFQRLFANWVYGGALAALVLLALTPFLALSPGLTAIYLCLPVYMLHQYEEHDDDRFRRFVNAMMTGKGRGLTRADVFWINIAGVWALLTVTLWLAVTVSPGWGSIATWLLGLNGLIHIAQAMALRRYNPGLVTAVVLFLPMAAWLFVQIPATLLQQIAGFGIVLALHAAILVRATRQGPTVP
ncbi:HXXEE domain-containing protein [Chachezhania sediminis]|uniref:HXXEE domain-containing protein n=1 Tax=Chachezhania sediminis TaxID=2599291 RepID=UPI00131EB573|nr:HXXEE domain-containing protein [Chachezhania sediminis]